MTGYKVDAVTGKNTMPRNDPRKSGTGVTSREIEFGVDYHEKDEIFEEKSAVYSLEKLRGENLKKK